MNFLAIHGANSSNHAWNWLSTQIKGIHPFHWELHENPDLVLDRFIKESKSFDGIIAHSLGGVFAWHVAHNNSNIKFGISIATPWGGIPHANLLGIRMASRSSYWTTMPRKNIIDSCQWHNVVCTRGFHFFNHFIGENDGTISVKTQKDLLGKEKEYYLDYGHNEVLQTPELVNIINTAISI